MFAEKSSVLLLLLRLHTTQFQCPALPTSNSQKAKVWEWKRKLGVMSRKDQNIVQSRCEIWLTEQNTLFSTRCQIPCAPPPYQVNGKLGTLKDSTHQYHPFYSKLQAIIYFKRISSCQHSKDSLPFKAASSVCCGHASVCTLCAQVLRRKSGKCELKRESPGFCSTFLPPSLGTRLYKIVLLISTTRFYAASQFAWFPRR